MNYWLFKSEPLTFSIDHLIEKPNKTDHWDGVRNYQARNFMRDEMEEGDLGFFYHSNCTPPGIIGVVEITRTAYPDFTAFDPQSPYYDPKSHPDKPRWFMVDVTFKKKFSSLISLETLKQQQKLSDMRLLQKGNRLSVMPVSAQAWKTIMAMAE